MAGGNIKVVVRVRPFNGRELDRRARCVVQMKDSQTILIPPPDAEERLRKGGKSGDGQKVFAFDKSYWSFNRDDPHFAGQDNLFNDLGSPLLDNAFEGYNNCIFAYGQTGSGKSYSMMGYGEEAGVIPKICRDMFERITKIQEDKNRSCTVEVSYLEIYNERVRDLLNPTTKGNLKVREHPATGPYVEDLAKLVVRSFKEIESLMDEGNKARTVAATNMNETSSRSHAVFTLTLTQKRHDVETSMDTEKVAKISLVDLAGSERATSTGATGARLKEGAEINGSLSTLGRVIAALADLSTGKRKNASTVPYRDSVLTWLLKDSLGGNSMTAMIAAISPADINFEETLSTLRYADSAKRIKNHAVINEDPNARMIRELKEELAQLRSKLTSGATSGGIAEEQYAPDTPLDKQIVSIVQADGTIKKVSKAEIAEQLSQSEKLYEDLNQTWEEKLQRTERIHKEREAALEELGISIEKGFVGLSTPKKMPHLVNLSDDPLLTECLVYNIKPGLTTVGNVEDSSTTTEIRLNGSKILREHCTFENTDSTVTIIPAEGAAVMVNGIRIDKPKRLRSGNRIILGDFHIFRFNHPQEARAERAEQSLLRHSVTTSQLGSPAPRPNHERTLSKAVSEVDDDNSRSGSDVTPNNGRDSDWFFARREAASAILGVDQKISNLTDDELDTLFDDVQRARAVRRGRPESRLFGTEDEDMESVSSYPVREKYLSTGTIDNFSLDTAITIPNTPQIDEEDGPKSRDERLQIVRDNLQVQLDKQKEEFEEQLREVEVSTQTMEELRAEKVRMEEDLRAAKEDLQNQLKQQKEEFEAHLQEMLKPSERKEDANGLIVFSDKHKSRARDVIEHWRQSRNVALTEAILKSAALLEEAQVMSQIMDKAVTFQSTIVDRGRDMCSSYDLVLNGISGEEDEALSVSRKPCVAVRVIDFQHSVIHLWSLEKLEHRVQAMRQMHQYLDRPDYMQHLGLENPFVESFLPQYSLVGDVLIPLTAVFEARVQDYAVPVISPYTQQVIGIVKLSLEPSSAEAPASMLKFNVVMHEMTGLAEREATEVHAQLLLHGSNEERGASTTQMISDFDEGPIRFGSVHSMSLPQVSSPKSSIQIAIFAKATSLHLDKLISWDEMREAAFESSTTTKEQPKPRIRESECFTQEQHDVFAKVQILEMAEDGEYRPTEVEQNHSLDPGIFQLHQGLQRRIAIHLTHTSSESLEWEDICSIRIGNIRLVDRCGKAPDLSSTPEIPIKLIQTPTIRQEASGATQIHILGQWDSSLHSTVLLNRPTANRYTIKTTLNCAVSSRRTSTPLTFTFNPTLQISPRAWLRPQSLLKTLWSTTRIVHSTTAIFSINLNPPQAPLYHQASHNQSSETLALPHWAPRRLSLLHDFRVSKRHQHHLTSVEATKVLLARHPTLYHPPHRPGTSTPRSSRSSHRHPTRPSSPTSRLYTPHQHRLLTHILTLWTTPPPSLPIPIPIRPLPTTTITATPHPPNPHLSHSGPLLLLAPTTNTWLRRYAELRPPYLHLYALDGEPVGVVDLESAEVEREPAVARLVAGRVGVESVWAVWGGGAGWVFAGRGWGGVLGGLRGVGKGERGVDLI